MAKIRDDRAKLRLYKKSELIAKFGTYRTKTNMKNFIPVEFKTSTSVKNESGTSIRYLIKDEVEFYLFKEKKDENN